jgi:hypothetical protein
MGGWKEDGQGLNYNGVMIEQEHQRLPPIWRCVMKEYDLSDRKLKIAFVLAVVLIGWLCFKGAGSTDAQTAPANLTPGMHDVVKF